MYSLVIPGMIIMGSAIFLFNRDYSSLVSAENNLSNLVRQNNVSEKRLNFAFHRARVHRINANVSQAWGLIGGIITAIGIHGIVTANLDGSSSSSSSGKSSSSGSSSSSSSGGESRGSDRR
jgi:uncharacterized membrane protein YgcG